MSDVEMSRELADARALLADAEKICVLTGAGVSAESGVPTFRGEEGLWKNYRAEELATPQAFRRDPRMVWEWYDWRRRKIGACAPNPGHYALAELALGPRSVRIVTQNVDGLHEWAAREVAGAGDPSPALPLEVHGSIFRVKCVACSYQASHRDPIEHDSAEALPRCPACRALLRPAVVWFGENLDGRVLTEAFDAARAASVCIVAGTSALVHPAASVPLATLESGGKLIEVNPEPTPLTGMAASSLRGGSGRVLPRLVEGLT